MSTCWSVFDQRSLKRLPLLTAFVLLATGQIVNGNVVAVSRTDSTQPGQFQINGLALDFVYTSGGVFVSDPAVTQAANGDAYVVGRDQSNGLSINVFTHSSQSWGTWISLGVQAQGQPAAAISSTGVVYVGARNSSNSILLVSYNTAGGGIASQDLSIVSATDPVMCVAQDGSVYLTIRDGSNNLKYGRYVPGTGFAGWWVVAGVTVTGLPSIVPGPDNRAYIAVRNANDTIQIASVQGNAATPSLFAAGAPSSGLSSDPKLAAANDAIFVTVLAQGPTAGELYHNRFTLATNTPGGWVDSTNHVVSFSPTTAGGNQLIVSARDSSGLAYYYTPDHKVDWEIPPGWLPAGYSGSGCPIGNACSPGPVVVGQVIPPPYAQAPSPPIWNQLGMYNRFGYLSTSTNTYRDSEPAPFGPLNYELPPGRSYSAGPGGSVQHVSVCMADTSDRLPCG